MRTSLIKVGCHVIKARTDRARASPEAAAAAATNLGEKGTDPMEPGITPMATPTEEPGSSVGRVQGLLDSTPLL